jgi:hypothetical protein
VCILLWINLTSPRVYSDGKITLYPTHRVPSFLDASIYLSIISLLSLKVNLETKVP